MELLSYTKRKKVMKGLFGLAIGFWVLYSVSTTFSQQHKNYDHPKPKEIDDRIRVIHKEILRTKLRLENASMYQSLVEYAVQAEKERTKMVYLLTPFFGNSPWDWMKNSKMFNSWEGIQCPYFRCRLTYSREDFLKADAVIFHAKDMPQLLALQRLLRYKPKAQKWVYFSLESPAHTYNAEKLNNLFHWTLTYRRDSDFYSPYGYYFSTTHQDKNVEGSISEMIKKKDKFIFWAASDCGKFRDKYIRKLLEYTEVDVYGKCRPFVGITSNKTGTCEMNDPKCIQLEKRYKFLLAFENSYCKDYITEKYWTALKLGLVPVVLGGGNYSNPELAIPGSYINALDFKTVKELADYLKYLDNNDKEYRKYFEWRKTYQRVDYAPWTCTLCAALNMNTKKTYISKLGDFWSIKRQCGLEEKAIDTILKTRSIG